MVGQRETIDGTMRNRRPRFAKLPPGPSKGLEGRARWRRTGDAHVAPAPAQGGRMDWLLRRRALKRPTPVESVGL